MVKFAGAALFNRRTTQCHPPHFSTAVYTFQEQLGWSPQSVLPGVSLQQGIWYDLGRVNQGYDADANLVPDYDVFLQPVGDPTVFNADAHRLVHSYGLLIVSLNDGTEQLIAFEDRLYFKDLPANNTGVVGLVFYEYAQIGSGSSTLSPYQEAASGSNNEKFNGDYGATSGSVMLAENPPLFDKIGPATTSLGSTINYTLTTTAPATNSFGLPQYGLPVVISDGIPAGTTYVAGSASSGISLPAGNTATVFYSTDGGLSWTTTEPSANLVTNLQWRLSEDLDANQVASVSFSTFVPLTYALPIVDNDAGVGTGGTPIVRDEVVTFVTGAYSISGVVFRDEGGGTGVAADGIRNGTESGLGAISVSLYLDLNNDGEVDPGDILQSTLNSTPGTGAYSFTGLTNGNYLLVADREDVDKPFGWQMSTADMLDVTIANANVTNQEFGFAPVVDVEKNLVGARPVYEGDQLITFTLDTTNLLGGAGGSTLPVQQDVWLSASAGGTDFTTPSNAFGAPDGTFSSGTSGTANNNLNLITPTGFVAQNTVVGVKVLMKIQLSGVLSNDTLVIDLVQQGVVRGSIYLSAAELNGFVSSAGLVEVDVSSRANWTIADFSAANTGLSLNYTRVGSNDAVTALVDGLGYRVQTAAIDPSAGSFFYSDAATNTITRALPNGTNATTFLSALGDDPDDIAYDTFAKKIYWAVTTGGFIRRANLDGSNIETIVTGGGTITGLDIDPLSRQLYWADSSGNRIVRANLDGTAQTTILSAVGTPQALAIDVGAGKIYFASSQANTLRRANLDGTGLETLIAKQDVGFNFNYPQDIEVDAINGRVYWSDSIGKYVAYANTTGTTAQIIASAQTIATGLGGVHGVAIDASAGFVFWVNETDGIITRANLDGSNAQTMITGLTTPREVEVAGTSAASYKGTFDINRTISSLTLTDDYDPARFEFVSASQNPSSVDTGTGLITWDNIGPLNAGVTTRITVTFRVLEPEGNLQQLNVENTAAITSAIMANGSPTNLDTDTATVTVNPTANIGDLIWNDANLNGTREANEGGISGVQVELVRDGRVIDTATTDANGAYLFTGVRDGTFTVRTVVSTLPAGMTQSFDADGTGTANQSTLTVAAAANNLNQDFGYGGSFLLSGTIWNDYDRDAVRDIVEPSLTSAIVALTVNGVSQGTTALDASGGYRFSIPTATAVAGAPYVITVYTPAGSGWTQSVDPNAAPLTNPFSSNLDNPLTSNTLINQNFAFYQTGTGSIGNEVFYDWDQDNVKDATDEGIPNITVTLYADLNNNGVLDPATDAPMLTTSTNASGNYSFTNLAAENYLVVVDTNDAQFPTNTTPSTVNPAVVTLAPGVNNTTTDFGYYKPGTGEITGIVWYDKNGNQVQAGSDEIGLANITVTLQADLNGDGTYVAVATTTSGADGSYAFGDLPFGNYRVIVDDNDADIPEDGFGITYDPTTVTTRDFTLSSGTPTATSDHGFGQLGSVGDIVFYDANRNGTQDYNETGIAGVTLQLRDNLNAIIATTVTDADGFYLFTGVAPGTYAVQVDTATLPAGITGANLIADPDRDGVPSWDNTYPSLPAADQRDDSIIVNFGVSYRGADFGYEPQGVVGDYIFRDLDADGVQDTGEIGISGVAVSITNGVLTFNTTTDPDGLYFFQNLSNGTWTVAVTPPAGYVVTGGIDANFLAGIGSTGANTATLTMSGGDLTAVNGTPIAEGNQKIDFGYRFNGTNTLSGTVVLEQQGVTDGTSGEATDTAVPNMGVFLYDNANNLLGLVYTDASGGYSFSNLPNGSFKVSMSATGALLQNTELTTVTGNTPATSVTNNGTSANQTLTLGGSVAGVDFAWVSTVDYDFGDLPAAYGTLIATDGARHIISGTPTLYLGNTPPDIELNGQSNATATGDGADEGGISVVSPAAWFEGANGGTLRAVVNGSGWLVGWMDFNNDGDFLDTNEMVMNQAVTTGTANYSFTVPAGALGGGGGVDIYSRFRLFQSAPPIPLLSYIGSVMGGEVEDYQLNVGVDPVGSISGTVYRDLNNNGEINSGETGIQNVTVTLTGTDDLGAAVNVSTTTDNSGNYTFANIRPSNATGYTITETQPAGFLDGLNSTGTSGGSTGNPPPGDAFTGVILTGGTDATGYNFGELNPASLSGIIYGDLDNDGVFDAFESGIPGATVTLTGTDDLGAITPIVLTTAPDGSYNFGNLRPGTYTITETQPGSHLDGTDTIGTPGGTTANDVFSNVVITEGVNGTDNNFGELLAATISGNIYRDLDNDGIQLGAGETGIGSVTVTLTGTDDFGAITPVVLTSAPDGTYSFGTLRPGTYTVTETQPAGFLDGMDTAGSSGGGTAGNDVISTITVASGITSANNNFGELPGTSLSGTVYRDFNNDGLITPGETGVGSVNVTLTGTDDLGASVNITIATQPDGTYTFQNLRPGTYSVSETQPAGLLDGKDTAGTSGGTPGAIGTDSITLITLPASTDATNYNFGELNPASLSGNVYADLDGDGVFDGFESGIRGATVTLSGTNDLGAITSIVATTDANGAYSFTNLRPGIYTITETQPADYTDGADTLGTGLTAPNSAGTAGNDVMSGITLASVAPGNNSGSNYNFGEQPNFTLTKTLVNTSEAGTSGSNVAIGETATFRLVVTIPVGSLSNFQVQDLLPAGYQYVNGSARAGLVGALTSSTITAPLAGVGSTPIFVLADTAVSDNALTNSDGYVSGTDVFFKFGDITNTDATAAVEAIVIEFDTVVVNEAANVAGTTLTNSFGILYERNGLPDPDPDPNPNPPPPVTTTVVWPQLTLTKSGTPTSGLEAGDNVTYTLTLTNPGGANASTAFDARILDVLPADLRATAINNVALNGGATTDSSLAITGGGTGLDGQFDIPVGGSVVITYTATVQVSVNPGASETNNAELTWTSINGGNSSSPDAGERYGAPGTIFGDTNLNNLRLTDSETVTVASGTFSKVLFGSSDPGTLGTNVAVGETVIYSLVITLPAGTTQTLNATDALPAGLQFVSSQIVTNAALSNGFMSADFNGTVPSLVVTGGVSDGDDVFFTFSNIVANADGVSGNNTFLLLVSARVTDVAGNSGSPQTTLPNVATFDDPNDPPTPFTPPPVTVDVVEPVLAITKDFNVAQADAGDTVQISIVVNNTGNGPAYDVVVDDAVNLAKFGSIAAVTTPAGFTFNNVAGNVSYTGGTIAAGESATFVFSVKLTDAVNPSEALNNIATATGTSQPGVVVGERTFGPVSDDATLSVPAIFTLTKGITSPSGGTVKIGDLVTYSVNVTLLEGTTNNISLTDLLPAGMTYLDGSAVVSNANGMTVNGFAANAVGNTLSISATSVVNPGNVDNTATTDSATFTITYQAVVDDVAGNVSGTLLTNLLTGGGDGTPPSTPPPVTTTVTEPQLQISKLVDDATANIGQTLHFTLTIQNLNVVNGADAYDLLVRDALPAGLADLANIVVNGASVDANNSTGSLLDLKLSQLALGATATITFDANVDANVDANAALVGTNIDNNARLYWDSQPGESANSVLTGTPDSDGDRDYGATGADEVFDATTDPAQDTERVSVNANTISGTIYHDADASGSFNLGDTGLGSQTVTLTGNLAAGGAAFTLTTTTDSNGNYTFNNVPAGTYVITETQPAGYVDGAETAGTPFGGSLSAALGSNVISSIVVPGGATDGTGFNFGEVLTSTFAGSVYEDVNDDGVRGIERGIGGVTITLTGTDFLGQSVAFTTTTNSTGDFNFDGGVNGLRPGTYTFTETTQPAGYPDGKDTSGTPSGTVTNDVIGNITIAQNTTASGYLFGELFPFDPVKSIVSTSNPGTTGNNVTIGETVRYRLAVALSGGLLNDYVIADNLPSGMSFLDDGTASLAFVSSNGTLISSSTLGTAPGVTDSNTTPSFTLPAIAISNSANSDVDGWSNGTDVFFRLGNLTNTEDVGRQYVIIEFNAQVLNVTANQQGRTLGNTFAPRFDLTGDGTNDPLSANVVSNTVRTPVVEPILSLDKQITNGPAQPKPGDTITFTVNISHAAGSGAIAWETLFTDTLPAGLQFVSVSTQVSGGAVATRAATFDGAGHVSGLFDIPVGGKITITYQVKVAANVRSGATLVNGADIQWTSAPGDDAYERKSGDSLLNKGGLNDYELKAQAQLTVSNPPPPTPFQYFYDRFNKWHRKGLDRDLATIYAVESPDNYRPPILPLAPIYSGEADPGSTLTLTLTNANGEVIGMQTVVVDAGGNWMATFPITTIRDFPNSVRIEQNNAFYSLSDSPGHNLRAYYSPALSPGHFFFEELRTIAQDTEAPLLSGLAIENPLGEGTTKYGGEILSTQGVAGGY